MSTAFIKNRKSLLRSLPYDIRRRRKVLFDIADSVLHHMRPEYLFKSRFTLPALAPFDRIVVFSIGKAAKSLASAVIKNMPRKPDNVYFADTGHPLPTPAGVQKTKRIISAARSLGSRDLAVICLSGGGSSMLVCPVSEISLEEKISLTQALLKSGATIQEMNIVRKHLSQIKGGRLAALLYPATVWGFVISDVPGNDLSTIASGPISPDSSTFVDAQKILKKYKIAASAGIKKYFEKGEKEKNLETPKPGEKYFTRVKVEILADHRTAAQCAAKTTKKLGISTIVLPRLLTGECAQEAKKFVKKAQKGHLIIACGETTVTARAGGNGGRNQEFALSALPCLRPNQTLLTLATDGVDGICPESIAGIIADEKTIDDARRKKLDVKKYLQQHDSYSFFKSAGGQLKTGRTGTNLGDVVMILS